jgi:dihydrofolate reductase
MRISVFVGLTIDGFLAREDGSFDYLSQFEGGEHGYVDFMRTVDVLVIGRATWDTVQPFEKWPYEGKRVVVLTHRPLEARHGETVHQGPLAPLAKRLEAEGVKHVYLDGGVAVRQGIDEGLVDDLTITTVPVMIGRGRPLLGGTKSGTWPWKLAASRTFEHGLVQSRWERA